MYLTSPPSYPPSLGAGLLSALLHHPPPARRNPFVFSVGRLVSRRCHIIDSIAQVSSDLRYYEGSDSCRVIPQSRSPRLLRLTFLTFHPQPRDAPVHRFTRHFSVYGEFQASPYPSRLAANIPPNQVRHPTDRQFASGCFPPRLTATQLPSATEPWHAPTRTSTVLIRRPHGRTRDAGYPAPPAQIPAGGTTAPGSSLILASCNERLILSPSDSKSLLFCRKSCFLPFLDTAFIGFHFKAF